MFGKNKAEIEFSAKMGKFNNDIKSANSTLATLRAGMALNEAQFKNTGDKAQYLKEKQEILKDELEQNRAKQEALNNKIKETNKYYGEGRPEVEKYTAQLRRTEAQEQDLERQLSETEKAIQEQIDAEKKAKSPLEQLNKKIEDQREELRDLKTQYANAAIAKGKDSDEVRDLKARIDSLNSSLETNERKLKDVTLATDEAGDSAEKNAKGGWNTANQVFANVASTGITKIIDKLGEAVKAVINLGMEFTKSMSNVQALSGASSSEMAQLEASAKELGRTTIFSASQVSDAFGYMALAGWETSDMLSGIDGVLNLAATSGMELADASDMVTDYLSAFGLEAQDAAGMVDMLAYAQANSNTTAEQLGDAFGNSASMMHTAGQTMETTTAILESFANQGMKGSEAGTALSAMMRDITQKMKNGKIMIGDTAIEVQDANGNFRNMIDILADVESATDGMGTAEKSAALMTTFTARSVKGVSMALTEGSDALSDYENQLYECTGSAEEMSEVMQDNLSGDMAAMQSAMEGLGLAIFGAFEEPLRDAAQFATDVFNGITDAIDPPKSTLQTFIDEIKDATDAAREAAEESTQKAEDATANITELAAYRDILLDLNEKTELNEFEQYQLKTAVDALADSVPGLADAYDETNGKLNITNEELSEMFDNAMKIAMQNALIEQLQGSFDALAESQLELAKARAAENAAAETTDETYAELEQKIKMLTESGVNYMNVLSKEEIELYQAHKAQGQVTEGYAEAQQAYDDNVESLKAVADALGITIPENLLMADSLEDLEAAQEGATAGAADVAEAVEDTGEVAGITAEEIESLAKSTGLTVEELQKMANSSDMTIEELAATAEQVAETRQAFTDLRDGVEESINDSISYMSDFRAVSKENTEALSQEVDQMADNLEGSAGAVESWVADMEKLGAEAGGKIPQALYDELLEQGPEKSAEAVAALSYALDNESGQLERIAENYAKKLDFSGKANELAKFSSAGKAVTGEVAKGIQSGSSDVETATGDMTSAAIDAMNREYSEGLDQVNETVNLQFESINSTINAAMERARQSVSGMIKDIKSALEQPIKGPAIKVPHFKMTGTFNAQTGAVPKVEVDWYAKGAIFKQPTIFNTPYGLKGVGERGAEAVLPIDLLRDYVADAISAAPASVVNVEMTVNGAENPDAWAAEFARTLKQQMRIG